MTATRSRRPALMLGALAALGLCAARPAAAQNNYFLNNATIGAGVYQSPINGNVIVGYYNGQYTSPTVNLVNGGSVSGYLQADGGIVNMSGGSVGNILEAANSSTVNMSGGTVSVDLAAANSSTVNVSGGSVSNGLFADQSSKVNVSGGTFGQYYGRGFNFYDETTGSLSFAGTGLSVTFLGADTRGYGGTDYQLTGLLQGGQSVSGDVIDLQSGAKMFTLTQVASQDYYMTGSSSVNYGIVGNAYVGYANASDAGNRVNGVNNSVTFTSSSASVTGSLVPGGSSTVTVNGGSFGYLVPIGNSKLNMTGGSVSNYLYAEDNSAVTMSGGTVGQYMEVANNSTATISGGTITGGVGGAGTSKVNISGGSFGPVSATDSSTVTITGGSVTGDLVPGGNSNVTVNGASVSVSGNVTTVGGSTLTFRSGTVAGYLYGEGTSTVNMTGGTVGKYVAADASSKVNISGGTVSSYVYTGANGVATISGGSFGSVGAVDFVDDSTGSGVLDFLGTGFSAVFEGKDTSGYGGFDFLLSGLLQNGQSVTGDLINVGTKDNMFQFNGQTADPSINASSAPEPSSVAAFAFTGLFAAGLMLRARRRGANAQG